MYSRRYAAGSNEYPSSGFLGIELTGGDGAHNNMPPYLTLNYIIKA